MLNCRATCRSKDKKPYGNTLEADDPEWTALSKYGETIFDVNGRLKSYAEIWESIARAYEKAKAAGEGVAFLQLTGGEAGLADVEQVVERWNEAKEDAEKIIKAKLDATELHEADRALNLLNEQFEELRDEIGNIFTPATQAAAEEFFGVFKTATKWIQENSAALQAVATATLEDFFTAGPTYAPLATLYNLVTKTKKPADELKNSVAGLNEELSEIDQNPLSQYGIQRTNAFRDELEDLRLELDYEDEFERRLAEAELWRQRELTDKLYVSTDERLAIEELYAAKVEQIHRDQADALEKIAEEQAEKERQILEESAERAENLMEETAKIQFAATHSAYEQAINDIENWKQKQLAALEEYKSAVEDKNAFVEEAAAITANALAKETEAFEKEIDRIKGKTQTLAEKIFEQEHSRRDIDIMKAQKERREMYDEGIYNPQMIEHWFKNRMGEIMNNVMEDTSGRYTKTPNIRSAQSNINSGYQIMYGDLFNAQTARLPNTDFYGNIQKQVDQAMERFKAPDQQFNQAMEKLQTGLDQSTQNLVKATDNLSNTFSNTSFGLQDFSAISNSLASASQRLADVSQHAGEIVQNVNKPQNINISPNISVNIDLGGAYVFDDNMKAQLTDDITKEVANAVTDAVSKATSQVDYGYGN